MDKKGLNYMGLLIAFFICIIVPVWIFGWKFLSMKIKLEFTFFGGLAVFYFVEYGGFKRGALTK